MYAAAVTQLVRGQVASIDPDLALTDVATLQAVVARSIDEPRFRATLIGAFAAAALLLAAVGVYGLISYSVAQRTREIGIRVALGARPGQILLTALREGFVLAATGIIIGLAASLALTRLLSAFLFGIRASRPSHDCRRRARPARRRAGGCLCAFPTRPQGRPPDSAPRGVVTSLTFASWNHIAGWLRQVDGFREAA